MRSLFAKAFRVLLAAGMLPTLSACDTAPNVKLYNGLGRPLGLVIVEGESSPKTVRLEPGGAVRIWNLGFDLRLTYEGCERIYVLPTMDLNFPWRIADGHGGSGPDYDHPYPVLLQLQPDSALYLMPDGARSAVSSRELEGVQGHGFKLPPTSTTCNAPTSPS